MGKSKENNGKKENERVKEVIEALNTSKTLTEAARKLGVKRQAINYYINKYKEVKEAYEAMKSGKKKSEKKLETIDSHYKTLVERQISDTILREVSKVVKAKAKYDIAFILEVGMYIVENYLNAAKAEDLDLKDFISKAVSYYLNYSNKIDKLENENRILRILVEKYKEILAPQVERTLAINRIENLMVPYLFNGKPIPKELYETYVKLLLNLKVEK